MRTDLACFSCGLALVLRETYPVLTFRIYKNSTQRSASGAFFSGIETSIPMIQIKFPSFDVKSAHPSVNLPTSEERCVGGICWLDALLTGIDFEDSQKDRTALKL